MKRLFLINKIPIILLLALIGLLPAKEVSKSGTSAAPFLKIPIGAKGVGMGSAVVSLTNDPTAIFWNPGGLARIEKNTIVEDYAPWLGDIAFNFIGFALPLQEYGVLGIGLTSLNTARMDITNYQFQDGTGEQFDASSTAIALSYANNLTDRFSIGATIKYINERIYNSNAEGFAVDIGTIYDTPLQGLKLGFSIVNFGTKMRITGEDLNFRVPPQNGGGNQSVVGQYKTEQFDLPLLMRVGVSYLVWHNEANSLVVAIDGVNPSDNLQYVNVGAEVKLFSGLLDLNAGFNQLFLVDRENGFTFGTQINTPIIDTVKLKVGYAFQSFEHLNDINRFTLNIEF